MLQETWKGKLQNYTKWAGLKNYDSDCQLSRLHPKCPWATLPNLILWANKDKTNYMQQMMIYWQ